jgi:hypothetical protein
MPRRAPGGYRGLSARRNDEKGEHRIQPDRIRLTSWTAAYRTALKTKNAILFSTTRTPERETLFQWVGPIAPTRVVPIARKDGVKDQGYRRFERLEIAALRDDIGNSFWPGEGSKASPSRSGKMRKLRSACSRRETVDAWAYEETAGLWLIKHVAADPGNYESVYSSTRASSTMP